MVGFYCLPRPLPFPLPLPLGNWPLLGILFRGFCVRTLGVNGVIVSIVFCTHRLA